MAKLDLDLMYSASIVIVLKTALGKHGWGTFENGKDLGRVYLKYLQISRYHGYPVNWVTHITNQSALGQTTRRPRIWPNVKKVPFMRHLIPRVPD